MIQRVIETGRRVGTPTGLHCMEPEDALRRAAQGMQFLAIGSDLRMLTTKAEEILKAVSPERARDGLARY